jgi:LPXTG-motif cell wall-anchored protein
MEVVYLMLGIALLVVFGWLLARNRKRSGFIHAVFRIDIVLGLVAGLYLVVTSLNSLFIH